MVSLVGRIMCLLWPFHLFFIYVGMLGPLWMLSSTVVAHVTTKTSWGVNFDPTEVKPLPIGSIATVKFTTTDLTQKEIDIGIVIVVSEHGGTIAYSDKTYLLKTEPISNNNWSSVFNVTGNFLGYTKIRLQLSDNSDEDRRVIKQSDPLPVTVVRPERVIDKLFTISVIVLVSVIYINFGCALDWAVVKKTIRRPLGPAIGFACQFIIMPLLSFALGQVLFPSSVPMQLGIFFTGVSPAGGASNIWTYILGGNLNLSITMTAISTFAAFAMIPLWIFTLGRVIFEKGKLEIPYSKIATFAIGLVVPLVIGFLIQKYLPRVSKVMVRILKPFSTLLILFIIIFAIITNLYLFELFTWQIAVAGLGLPWLGYICGFVLAHVFKQSREDILAISLETGIQNTGMSIFLLRTLGQPEADLTTVVPVAVATMTPIPLLLMFVYCKCSTRGSKTKSQMLNPDDEENPPRSINATESMPIAFGSIK